MYYKPPSSSNAATRNDNHHHDAADGDGNGTASELVLESRHGDLHRFDQIGGFGPLDLVDGSQVAFGFDWVGEKRAVIGGVLLEDQIFFLKTRSWNQRRWRGNKWYRRSSRSRLANRRSLEEAIQLFYLGNEGSNGVASSSIPPQGDTHLSGRENFINDENVGEVAGDDGVRAPLPVKRETLYGEVESPQPSIFGVRVFLGH